MEIGLEIDLTLKVSPQCMLEMQTVWDLNFFLKVHRFIEIGLEIDLTLKVSPQCMLEMQTVWDLNLRAMSMFGLISEKKRFWKNLIFTKNGVWS